MIKVGDNVRVITGSNKGKEGKVLKVLRNENRVVVDGVNVVKKGNRFKIFFSELSF